MSAFALPLSRTLHCLVLLLMIAKSAIAQEDAMPVYGDWVCNIIYRLTGWLPKTPEQYWMGTLVAKLSESLPFIGRGILLETVNILKSVLLFSVS